MLGPRIRGIPRWGWGWMLLAAVVLGFEIFRDKPLGIVVASALLVAGVVRSVRWRPKPLPEALPPAPGWYAAGPGFFRWWDGNSWTDAGLTHPPYAPMGNATTGAAASHAAAAFAPRWYQRRMVMVSAATVAVMGALVGITLYGHHINTAPHTVAFRVTADSETANVTATYTNAYGHTYSFTTANAKLPWQVTMVIKGDDSTYHLRASNGGGTVITCMISVDGHIAAQQSSTDGSPAVRCDGGP